MLNKRKMWFHIKARDMDMFKPEGKVLTFWLWADSRERLDILLKSKNMTDIEWIKEHEKSPFE